MLVAFLAYVVLNGFMPLRVTQVCCPVIDVLKHAIDDGVVRSESYCVVVHGVWLNLLDSSVQNNVFCR